MWPRVPTAVTDFEDNPDSFCPIADATPNSPGQVPQTQELWSKIQFDPHLPNLTPPPQAGKARWRRRQSQLPPLISELL